MQPHEDTWAAWNNRFQSRARRRPDPDEYDEDDVLGLDDEPEDEEDDEPETLPAGSILTLSRQGSFTLHVRGDNFCGVSVDGTVECEFDVEIECEADSLDHRGFLIEQLGIVEFFRELPETSLSCENLVVKCAKQLHEKIQRENPNCKVRRMSVEISPESDDGSSSVTLDWTLE